MKQILDPFAWFSKRELDYRPRHFTTANTPITPESRRWIQTRLNGRYAIVGRPPILASDLLHSRLDPYLEAHIYGLNEFGINQYPTFENPNDAILYELTWS